LFDDLNPSVAGTVSWKQTADRIAVTYQDVPELGSELGNSFQLELFFDGRVGITLLEISAEDGLAGLSEGLGVPPEFTEMDLSGMPSCAAGNGSVPGEAGVAPQLLVTGYEPATEVMSLTYGVPCEASAHVIEYGRLSRSGVAGYQWDGQECGLDPSGAYEWDTAAIPHESVFFVIVANNGSAEGSYGTASDGSERLEDDTSTACPYPQDLPNTCE
jgi:hypothetical protein